MAIFNIPTLGTKEVQHNTFGADIAPIDIIRKVSISYQIIEMFEWE